MPDKTEKTEKITLQKENDRSYVIKMTFKNLKELKQKIQIYILNSPDIANSGYNLFLILRNFLCGKNIIAYKHRKARFC